MCPTCGKPQLTERPHQHTVASRRAWDEALSDPAFREALDNGLADVAAGRVRPWNPDPLSVPEPEPPRLPPPDDGNPGTVIALVVLAAIVALAVVGWWVAVPR